VRHPARAVGERSYVVITGINQHTVRNTSRRPRTAAASLSHWAEMQCLPQISDCSRCRHWLGSVPAAPSQLDGWSALAHPPPPCPPRGTDVTLRYRDITIWVPTIIDMDFLLRYNPYTWPLKVLLPRLCNSLGFLSFCVANNLRLIRTVMLTASAYWLSVQCQPSITEVSEQLSHFSVINGRPLTSRRIWTILPRWAAKFHELARRILQNFPRKTVGPRYIFGSLV